MYDAAIAATSARAAPVFWSPLKAIQGILIRNRASAKARFRRRI